jgi:hypothetical protein
MKTYQEYGLEQQEWQAITPCDKCAMNEGAIVTIGSPFPSGVTQPPQHPHCRCALLPVIPDMSEKPNANGVVDIAPVARLSADDILRDLNEQFPQGTTAILKPKPIKKPVTANAPTPTPDLKGKPITAREMNEAYSTYRPTDTVKEAFQDYQESGFFEVNARLRAGEAPPQLALEMDKAFIDAPKIPSAREYYRTTDSSVFSDMKEGQLFVDQGYTSTSISKSEALTFGEDAMYDAKVRIIDTGDQPKIWMDAVSGREGASQQEVVFQRGTPFTYLGQDKQGFHVLITERRK